MVIRATGRIGFGATAAVLGERHGLLQRQERAIRRASAAPPLGWRSRRESPPA